MSVKALNTYTANVTPKLAEAWLAFNYAHQRPLSLEHVMFLSRAMQRGTFTTNTIKFAMCGTNRYMFNGQHTLHAIIDSGCSLLLPVEDFVTDDMGEVERLYYHEDINRKRTFADSARAVSLGERTGLTRSQIDAIAAALRFARANFGVDRKMFDAITFDDMLEMTELWQWEIKAIYAAITPCSGADRSLVIKQSVLSVALITMRYAPSDAREFWRQVAQDDGIERYDPRKTIRQWLIANARRPNRGSPTIARPNEISRAVALAWNAWCDRRLLRYTLVRDTTRPIELRKCGPFTGNQSPNFIPLSTSPNADTVIQPRMLTTPMP